MGYQKNGDDNGRIEGTFETLTAEHIVGSSMIQKDKEDEEWSDEIEQETTGDTEDGND